MTGGVSFFASEWMAPMELTVSQPRAVGIECGSLLSASTSWAWGLVEWAFGIFVLGGPAVKPVLDRVTGVPVLPVGDVLGAALSQGPLGWSLGLGPMWSVVTDMDPVALAIELWGVALALALVPKVPGLARAWGAVYEALASLCVRRGLSLTEVAVALGLGLGFLALDALGSVSEEDVVDALGYGLLILLILVFGSLALTADVHYTYMVSSVGGGATLRAAGADLVNNLLCALRVLFCWVRYALYDLQVEALDLAFHYTDATGDPTLGALVGPAEVGASWGRSRAPIWSALGALGPWAVLTDIFFTLVQIIVGALKLLIALCLLWLLVDLFVLRALALSERAPKGPGA